MGKKSHYKLLTEVELELMVILWRLKKASVRDVLEEQYKRRNLAYTSAATVMRILEKKGFVKSDKDGKTFIYQPLISKAEYESRSINHMVTKLFDDTPQALVARLIDSQELNEEELAELRELINKR